jgi:hypothetical protein
MAEKPASRRGWPMGAAQGRKVRSMKATVEPSVRYILGRVGQQQSSAAEKVCCKRAHSPEHATEQAGATAHFRGIKHQPQAAPVVSEGACLNRRRKSGKISVRKGRLWDHPPIQHQGRWDSQTTPARQTPWSPGCVKDLRFLSNPSVNRRRSLPSSRPGKRLRNVMSTRR